MATNSQLQETPEYRTFREHYDRLYHAIQDPLSLATQLFTRSIVTSAVTGRMIAVGLSTLEKNGVLLSAIEMQIRTDPRRFYEFLSALIEDPALQSLVESMQSKCCALISVCPISYTIGGDWLPESSPIRLDLVGIVIYGVNSSTNLCAVQTH